MAKITKKEIDPLNLSFTVEITRADYQGALDKELKKYRKQAQLKGFRKGKTPMSALRKMFGQQVLAQVVSEELQKAVNEVLKEEPNYIGQPISAEDTPELNLDINSKEDLVFKFDLGRTPDFELQGLDTGHTFEYFMAKLSEEEAQEELHRLRIQSSRPTEVNEDEDIKAGDIITVTGVELVGGLPKVDGITHEFTIFMDNLAEEVQQELLGKRVGDSVRVNIFELEKDISEDQVRKYLLGLDEEDEREVSPEFELTINKVSRILPREMNQEFFDEVFGAEQITSEEEAIAYLKAQYQKDYTKASDSLLFRSIQEYLMEQNSLELPDRFLKRWLVESEENYTIELVEEEYERFAKGLRWTLIRNKLINHFKLNVTPEELKASFVEEMMSYFGQKNRHLLSDRVLQDMAERMLKDEKAVRRHYEQLFDQKLIQALKETYTLQEKEVTPQELQALIEEANAEDEANGLLLDEEE
ncbi:MAG: trigger factor [Bacteroidetes bacterium]|nr:MAG: trigger factor [Bacteroidota bacterium]